MRDAEIIVVGAGLSGLVAATRLHEAGRRVAVVEARDRVGGRTLSPVVDGQAFDLGGQWIGAGQRRLARLAEALGCATFETWHAGDKVMELAGRRRTYGGDIPKLSPMALVELHRQLGALDRMMRLAPVDALGGPSALDAMSVDDYRRRHVRSDAVRRVLDVAVRVVFGAEPGELSMQYFLTYLRAGDGLLNLTGVASAAQERRFVDGAQALSLRLAARLGAAVQLGAPVRVIEQGEAGVVVQTDAGAVRGARVIVAIPPALAGRIDYQPGLPPLRDALTQRFAMGATTKALVFYARPFWREQGLSGEAISDGDPVGVVFDNSGPDGAPWCLVAFIVGRAARVWDARPPESRRAAVLAHLARLFGEPAARPVRYVEQVWSAEPWTRGCPTGGLPAGGMVPYAAALRRPCGRIHWAGTETARSYCGYLEGAIEAGERAASEALDALAVGR
ncbi:MAG: FAD-dependent oxidoreductase [Myxococcales bacterium]|nr:FAD-dependent oxidoreductase [Myxococcales bacterium]